MFSGSIGLVGFILIACCWNLCSGSMWLVVRAEDNDNPADWKGWWQLWWHGGSDWPLAILYRRFRLGESRRLLTSNNQWQYFVGRDNWRRSSGEGEETILAQVSLFVYIFRFLFYLLLNCRIETFLLPFARSSRMYPLKTDLRSKFVCGLTVSSMSHIRRTSCGGTAGWRRWRRTHDNWSWGMRRGGSG